MTDLCATCADGANVLESLLALFTPPVLSAFDFRTVQGALPQRSIVLFRTRWTDCLTSLSLRRSDARNDQAQKQLKVVS